MKHHLLWTIISFLGLISEGRGRPTPRSLYHQQATDAVASASLKLAGKAQRRECALPCPVDMECPIAGGVCCAQGSVCCPSGSTCLLSEPPTCLSEEEERGATHRQTCDAGFKMQTESCKEGLVCPHDGVNECCAGGTLCCPPDYSCHGDSPPSCIRVRFDTRARANTSSDEPSSPPALPTAPHRRRNDSGAPWFSPKDRLWHMQQASVSKFRHPAPSSSSRANSTPPHWQSTLRGLCMFAAECSVGWTDAGKVGILMSKDSLNPFDRGDKFDQRFSWVHPRVCCAASRPLPPRHGFNFLGVRGNCSGTNAVGTLGAALPPPPLSDALRQGLSP